MNKKITGKYIEKIVNLSLTKGYYGNKLSLVDDFSNNSEIDLITFIDDKKYLKNVLNNNRIRSIFTTYEIWNELMDTNIQPIICDDPRFYFYSLYNYIANSNYKKTRSIIAGTAKIHPMALISEFNVVIGRNVEIGPNVTILPDVEVGENSVILAGAILGCKGFELKRTKKGILSVTHDGKLIIGNDVQIGYNTTIYKGFFNNNTIIGDSTKIDNLVYIAHGVKIGKECFIVGNSMISGSTELGDRVWVGPGAIISNKLKIGNDSFISIGSVVTQDVMTNQRVTGNFAIEHKKFVDSLKRKL